MSFIQVLAKKIFLLVVVSLLTGCAARHKLVRPQSVIPQESAYVSETPQQDIDREEEKYELNVAIVPFAEKRGELKNYGGVYKYLIPLVPYGTIRYERPDEAKMFNLQNEFEFDMSENLLKILVEAVRGSSLFGEVILTPTPLVSKADVILSGDIYSTLYEGKTYSYGISFLGPALWCFGLPAGSSHKKLHIGLYLKKIDTGELIWSYNLNKEKTVVQGLYRNWGKDVNSFANLMEEGIKEVVSDLRSKLSQIPPDTLKVKIPEIPSLAQPESVSSQIEPSSSAAFVNTTDATK